MTVDQQLDKFAPIDLKQMDRVKLLQRTDTKYLLSKDRLLDLFPALFEHYYVLEVEGKRTSAYHTIYLDTPDKKYFKQHHQGRYKRHKVRFRTYIETGISFLEVKLKQKGITNKKRISTTIQEDLDQNQSSFLISSSAFIKPLLNTPLLSLISVTLSNINMGGNGNFAFPSPKSLPFPQSINS